MIAHAGNTDWDAGNAALRARRSRLLSGPALLDLLDRGLDELVGALSDTDWRTDIEAALARYRGLRVLQEAARTRLARQLGRVRALYGGDAGAAIDIRLARYDVDNLVTVLRGQARGVDGDRILPMLVPAGQIRDPILAELLRQPGLRATLDRMVALGVPDPSTALKVLGAWTGATSSPILLERALRRAWALGVKRALDAGVGGAMLARTVRDRIDQDNLLAVLRLWSRLEPGERARQPLRDHLLPGGRLGLDVLSHAWSRRDPPEVAAALTPSLWTSWHGPVDRWAESADLSALADVLDELRTYWALGLFVRGDPLSLAVPLAFIAELEVEVRNLRVVAHGAALKLPSDVVRSRLWLQERAWDA